jgi:hypothetical protein
MIDKSTDCVHICHLSSVPDQYLFKRKNYGECTGSGMFKMYYDQVCNNFTHWISVCFHK